MINFHNLQKWNAEWLSDGDFRRCSAERCPHNSNIFFLLIPSDCVAFRIVQVFLYCADRKCVKRFDVNRLIYNICRRVIYCCNKDCVMQMLHLQCRMVTMVHSACRMNSRCHSSFLCVVRRRQMRERLDCGFSLTNYLSTRPCLVHDTCHKELHFPCQWLIYTKFSSIQRFSYRSWILCLALDKNDCNSCAVCYIWIHVFYCWCSSVGILSAAFHFQASSFVLSGQLTRRRQHLTVDHFYDWEKRDIMEYLVAGTVQKGSQR